MNEPQRHRGTEIEEQDPLTGRIIGAAIEVHRVLGPGLLEPVYERALCIEFDLRRLKYEIRFVYQRCTRVAPSVTIASISSLKMPS